MFDGIDHVVLPAADVEPLRRLYVELFGFTEVAVDDDPDPAWQQLWQLPAPPTRSVMLGKPRSAGGWIRLVEVPGLPPASPARRPNRVGPYALDFYLRDADAVEQRIEEGGWEFRTPAVYYNLPGTDIPVRERMLDQPLSGLLHAVVQYRPRGTRCVIDQDRQEDTSEVVAVVFMTDRFEEATAFARDVLGARQYFTGRFDGPAVEQMLGMAPGEGFAAALFRGPGSRNARLEFAEVLPDGEPRTDLVRRVVATCAVPDLDALHTLVKSGDHGETIGPVTVDGVRHLGLASSYGAAFDFFEPL
ncbi:hypothetical protein GCM10011608_44830 [Micromonospora sonchi]|uniref:VOC domain-containing protein n=1 Tax=Micromonospora sonchi TaxID=1763543 RepID=A0A917U394_9ACTN|nr:VOC family protein [Micromonospora sonchi]GGM54959.1 hypothetical protein GCM10011608_44830 [Micromonospora sonchi]